MYIVYRKRMTFFAHIIGRKPIQKYWSDIRPAIRVYYSPAPARTIPIFAAGIDMWRVITVIDGQNGVAYSRVVSVLFDWCILRALCDHVVTDDDYVICCYIV